jgi:hypothetical protein
MCTGGSGWIVWYRGGVGYGYRGREHRWGGTYVEAPGFAAAILLTKKGNKETKKERCERRRNGKKYEREMQKCVAFPYTGCDTYSTDF